MQETKTQKEHILLFFTNSPNLILQKTNKNTSKFTTEIISHSQGPPTRKFLRFFQEFNGKSMKKTEFSLQQLKENIEKTRITKKPQILLFFTNSPNLIKNKSFSSFEQISQKMRRNMSPKHQIKSFFESSPNEIIKTSNKSSWELKNKIVKLAQEHEIKDDEITFITENLQITDVKRPENKHNQHRKLINFFIQAPIQIYDNSSNHMNKFYVNLNAQMTFSEKKLKNTKNIFTFFIKGPELILHRSASQIEHLTLAITNNSEPFAMNYSNISPIIDEQSQAKFEEDSILNKLSNSKYNRIIMNSQSIKKQKNKEIDDLLRFDALKKAEQAKRTLEQRLFEVNNQIDDLKTSLILDKTYETPPQPHQLKKMIEISDDHSATEKAEFLVRRLKNDKKLRELKKKRQMEKLEEQIKASIGEIKHESGDKVDRVKYEKHQDIFERLDKHEKNKLNIVSSEFNNVAFIKGLYKGAHYHKPLRDLTKKNRVILPHIPRDLYSIKLSPKEVEKIPSNNPIKIIASPKKLGGLPKEYLADRIEREEKILIEREKILLEEKNILEKRKKQFETKNESKKLNKELGDIEKALFNYQSLKKYDLSLTKNKSQDNIIEEEKFLEYKNELKSWEFGHILAKSQSPEIIKKDNERKNNEFKIRSKISKGIQTNADNEYLGSI